MWTNRGKRDRRYARESEVAQVRQEVVESLDVFFGDGVGRHGGSFVSLYYTHHPKHTCARNPHQLLEFCGGTLGSLWCLREQSFSGGEIVVVGRIGEVRGAVGVTTVGFTGAGAGMTMI